MVDDDGFFGFIDIDDEEERGAVNKREGLPLFFHHWEGLPKDVKVVVLLLLNRRTLLSFGVSSTQSRALMMLEILWPFRLERDPDGGRVMPWSKIVSLSPSFRRDYEVGRFLAYPKGWFAWNMRDAFAQALQMVTHRLEKKTHVPILYALLHSDGCDRLDMSVRLFQWALNDVCYKEDFEARTQILSLATATGERSILIPAFCAVKDERILKGCFDAVHAWEVEPLRLLSETFGLDSVLRESGAPEDVTAREKLVFLVKYREHKQGAQEFALRALVSMSGLQALVPLLRLMIVRQHFCPQGEDAEWIATCERCLDDPTMEEDLKIWLVVALGHRKAWDIERMRRRAALFSNFPMQLNATLESVPFAEYWRSGIAHDFDGSYSLTNPRWCLEGILFPKPFDVQSVAERLIALLSERTGANLKLISACDLHGTGGGNYWGIRTPHCQIDISEVGPFCRIGPKGHWWDYAPGENLLSDVPEFYVEAVEKVGLKQLTRQQALALVPDLPSYYFGRKPALVLHQHLFYWQD